MLAQKLSNANIHCSYDISKCLGGNLKHHLRCVSKYINHTSYSVESLVVDDYSQPNIDNTS